MDLHFKQLFDTKHTLFKWIVMYFIFCSFSLKANHSGGNDTLEFSSKTGISINKQKLLIRNMSAEELTAFIDETFDMDSIPVDIINEINWAVAKLEKRENAFENVVKVTDAPTSPPSKTEEVTKGEPIKEVAKVKEVAPLKMLKSSNVKLRVDDHSKNITKAELKAPEVIIPIPKKENIHYLPVPRLTLTEKEQEAPVSRELVKNTAFIVLHEKDNVQPIPVVTLAISEKNNDLPVSKELVKNRMFNQMNFLNTNPVFLTIDNNAGSVSKAELKTFEMVEVTPKFIVSPLAVAKLLATESKNEIPAIHDIVKIKEAVNLKTFEINTTTIQMDDLKNNITATELNTNKIITLPVTGNDLFVEVDTTTFIPESKMEKRPTPLTLLKQNLANNTNNTNTPAVRNEYNEFKISGTANNLNASAIPSSDYYVSWEIDKLFPEKDMLKMKADTAITLVLLNKVHCHYFHPFNGPITSGFGWRDSAQHNGIDIDLNKGDKVSAAFDGMVRVARRYGGFGNVVIIRHYNGLETVYAHLSKIKVKPGQLVSSGDLVGLGGSTGHSTGSHLHFEIRFKGVPINPKYLISLSQQKLMCDEFTLKKTKWGLAVYPKNTKMYTVEKGDTVFEIAKRFGTTTASIKELNHLGGGRVRLKAGQQINVAH